MVNVEFESKTSRVQLQSQHGHKYVNCDPIADTIRDFPCDFVIMFIRCDLMILVT